MDTLPEVSRIYMFKYYCKRVKKFANNKKYRETKVFMNQGIDRIQRNPFLDYFRGISALLVMLFHYTFLYGSLYGHIGDYPIIVNRGSFAVLMFFLLSGYLTFKGMSRYRPLAFVRSRFFRLYPTFWFCLIPTMILVTIYLPDRAVSMKDFLLNFTMIPMYLGADFVDGAYWTLSCDVFFYALIVTAGILKGGKYSAQIIIGWFIFQLLLLGLPDTGLIAIVKKINRFLFFHCFMAGGVVALLEKQWLAKKEEKMTPLMVVSLCAALVFLVSQQFIDHETDSGVFLAVSVVLLGISAIVYTKWGGHLGFRNYYRLSLGLLLYPIHFISYTKT